MLFMIVSEISQFDGDAVSACGFTTICKAALISSTPGSPLVAHEGTVGHDVSRLSLCCVSLVSCHLSKVLSLMKTLNNPKSAKVACLLHKMTFQFLIMPLSSDCSPVASTDENGHNTRNL